MTQILILQDLGISLTKLNEVFASIKYKNQLIHGISDINLIDEKVQIIITIKEKVDAQLLKKFPNTKLVAVAFTGFDAVDNTYCKQHNISVCNVPSYATDAVAELTIGLAISLLRAIPETNQLLKKGAWNFAPGQELKGKNVGIIGTGTIGLRVAKLFKVFGCNILGWSRSKNQHFIDLGGIYTDDLNKLCCEVDILTIHIPLNESTKNLIDTQQLQLMKPTAFIINTARGPIINEISLAKALQNNQISGATIDVFDVEPILSENKLLQTKNSILTPHIGYKTQEALERRASITAANIEHFNNGNPINLVN